jgi:hypothetical protein
VPEQTFESFMRRYGPADGRYHLIDVGHAIEAWPFAVVKFGDQTAVLQFCGLAGADGTQPLLSIIVHAFVADRIARAGVHGMENGKRYDAFDDTAPGTSHGWPAVQGVTILVGGQTTRANGG